MTAVLVAPSAVACPHPPGLVTAGTSSRLTVGKQPVLLAGLTGKDIAGCTTPANPPSTKPCLKVLTVTAGERSKLTVGGVPVLLADVAGTTDGVPAGSAVTATANQTRLTAAAAVA
ncbi:hypothetical protein OHA21_17640 [Actinoplanes sp. NBC_00393]|uniref:hypothetical protein n=1 Tax=Actinoplanes sp. NBC_00393 TaxID=2975953 RepID=UPI002E1A49B0